MIKTVCLMTLVLGVSPLYSATFNATDFGIPTDAKTDAAPAIQKAMDEAVKQPGSTVLVPAGKYLINNTIYVRTLTRLVGQYPGQGRSRGTIFLVTAGKGKSDGPGCLVMEAASQLKGIAFEYPEQSADLKEPIPYPYTITSAGGDLRIEDVFLYNSYQGINLDGCHANLLRGIWGEPLKIGINADHIYDISRIENVHFWPYFTLNKPLRSYVQSHGTAFQFGRSDWQYVFNTFCYGYRTGYRFYHTNEVKEKGWPQGSTNGNFHGIGADCVGIALDIEDSFNIGISISNGEFGPFGGTNTRGILLRKGNTGNLTLTNCNFWAVPEALVEVQDGSLNLTACNIHEFAIRKKEDPCFLISGGRVTVNACTFNQGGRLAVITGDKTRATFTSNMGEGEYVIESEIKERLVTGMNNPVFTVK